VGTLAAFSAFRQVRRALRGKVPILEARSAQVPEGRPGIQAADLHLPAPPQRLRRVAGSLTGSQRPQILGFIRGIEAKAADGDLAMIRLRDSGVARSVRDAFDWVSSHHAELATHLT
jgi:hypothetical protein